MSNLKNIKIGSRSSPLALWQANRIKTLLAEKYPDINSTIVQIETSGDIDLSRSISEIGGKGVFLKELEQSLIDQAIDIAVHSFKDITATSINELHYIGFLLEESVTDAFILFNQQSSLSSPATIATGSLRRKALCHHLYPKVTCVDIRGNIQTRINMAKELGYDGLLLSLAGLERLKLNDLVSIECDPKTFIPAPGQGFLAIQARKSDVKLSSIIQSIIPKKNQGIGNLYYQLLKGINFNCNLPLGAYIVDQHLHIFLEYKTPQYFVFKLNEIQLAIDTIKGVIFE